MELRIKAARTTKDIDLTMRSASSSGEKKDDKKKRRREKPEAQAASKGKAAAGKPEGPEAGREGGPSGHERTHVHPSAAKGGRRDRGTGMTKKGQ